MLAQRNKIVAGSDYRRVSRKGRRVAGEHLVASVLPLGDGEPPRFGFVITRKVGNAVVRNRIRRRLKAACRDLVESGTPPREMVLRVLPAAVSADWDTLRREIENAAMKGVR